MRTMFSGGRGFLWDDIQPQREGKDFWEQSCLWFISCLYRFLTLNEWSVSMTNKNILLIAAASFLGWSISHASVTSVPTWNSSGGVYCYATLDTASQSVAVDGSQWSSSGTMGLTIMTDTATDPILTLGNSINNTSSFAWTEYVVTVGMNQLFTINSASASLPSGWTATITAPSGPDISGNYAGIIDYKGGTPVAINGLLDFSYVVQFSGSTQYSLTESVNAVPEPGAFSLLMCGGLLLGGLAVAKRRQVRLQTIV
jgi:hypothetical protein